VRLTDLCQNGLLAQIVSEELGRPAQYLDSYTDTVDVPLPIPEGFLRVQLQELFARWVCFGKGPYVQGYLSPVTAEFMWARLNEPAPSITPNIPLLSVQHFRELLQRVKAGLL
jgi:hypothetical protein